MADELNLKFNLKKGTDELNKSLKDNKKQASELGDIIKKIGIGAIAFVGISKITEAISKSIKSASDYQAKIGELDFALKQLGETGSQGVKDFADFASEIQKITAYSDDAVVSTGSLIATLAGIKGEKLKEITKLTLDFATAARLDAQTAAQLVVKGVQGMTSAFSRYGIQVKKGASETENYNNIVKALGAFTGASEAKLKTYEGAMANLGNAVDDLYKSIGLLIIENKDFIGVINGVTKAVIDLTSFSVKALPQLGKALADAFGTFGSGSVVSDKFSATKKQIEETDKATKNLSYSIANIEFPEALKGLGFETLTDGLLKFDSISKKIESPSAIKEISEEAKKATIDINNMINALLKSGADDRGKIDFEYDEQLRQADDLFNKGLINVKKLNEFRIALNEDYYKKYSLLDEKERQEREKAESEAMAKRATQQQAMFGQIGGLISNIGQGAEGARSAVVGIGAGIAEKLLPGLGQAVGPLLDVLSKGKDAVRDFVRDFASAIPEIIEAIIESLPVLIEELIIGIQNALLILAEKADIIVLNFVSALIKAIPRIISAFISYIPRLIIALVSAMPQVAIGFVEALVKEAPKFIDKLIDEIKGAFNFLGGGSSGGGGIKGIVGGVVGTVSKVFKFSNGGIAQGKDNLPAMLTAGERVLSVPQTRAFETMVDKNFKSSTDMNETNALLGQILIALGREQSANVSLNLNGKELANSILMLNRANMRLA